MDRAGIGSRLAAAFFDVIAFIALLVTEVAVLVSLFLAWVVVSEDQEVRQIHPGWLIAFVGGFHLLLLALTALEIFIGKSFGKLLVGLKIRAADGTEAGRGALTLRWALKYSPLILLLVVVIPLSLMPDAQPMTINVLSIIAILLFIGVLVAFFFTDSTSRQALYDRVAGTVVVRTHTPGETPGGTQDMQLREQ